MVAAGGIDGLGFLLSSIGLLMVILSFTTLTWFVNGPFTKDFSFFHTFSDEPGPGLFKVYFGWLAVTWLVLSGVCSYAVVLWRSPPLVVRLFVAAVGIGGAVITVWALLSANSFSETFDHARSGVWATLVGFVLLGVASVTGMIRRR